MKITSIQIKGFKNLEDLHLSIGDFNALISYNNYGKSNVLEAIQFGFKFIGETPEQKTRMLAYIPGIPLNTIYAGTPFFFRFEFQTVLKSGSVAEGAYSFSCSWRTTNQPGIILEEHLQSKDGQESQKTTTLISRENKDVFYKPSRTGRCDKPILVKDNELVLNKLLAFDDLYYRDLLSSLSQIQIYLDRHFDAVKPYEASPFVTNPDEMLSMDSPLGCAGYLYAIHEQHKEDFDLIENTIKDIFPSVKELIVRKVSFLNEVKKARIIKDNRNGASQEFDFDFADFVYVAYVNVSNLIKPINLSQMSDGFRRILLILTCLKIAQYNGYSLLGVEEPENSINPSLLKRFLTCLRAFAFPSQIIITSHSPFLVNYLNLQDVNIGLPNPNGFATFRKIKTQSVGRIEQNAKAMDMPTGEYLFDVLSGDEKDLMALEKYLEK
jgi:predicted ATPase